VGEPEITMTHATPAVKAPKTKSAGRCARCNRELKAGVAHTVTPIGILGSECEQYAAAALMILHRAGLGVLATQGEIRFPTIRREDGTVEIATPDAVRAYTVMADRIDATLTYTYDPRTREFVYSLTRKSAHSILNRRAQGMQA